MNKLSRITIGLSLVLVFSSIKAQTVSPVDFMRLNPYQMIANPATDLPYRCVFSFPMLGNIGMDLQNTSLRYDNLFEFNAEGRPTIINLRKFANSIKEDNYLGLNTDIDVFTFYHRLGKGMMTFDWSVKSQFGLGYNDGLFKLLAYGNSAFVGEDHPVKINLNVNERVYQEFALGYQRKVNEHLSVGGRAKLLFGLADVTTDVCEAKLFTDADTYALRLEENVAMKAALPNAIYVDENGIMKTDGPLKVDDLFGNLGFGLDLAVEYRINKHFSAVAAIQDLGFIQWDKNNVSLTSNINDAGQFYDDGGFLFSGLDVEQLQLISSDELYRKQFLDTLQQYFQLELSPLEKYNTALNTNILLRGNYDVNACNRFSVQLQGCFLNNDLRPAMTLAYSGSFFKMLDVCATYTMVKNGFDNLGIGLGCKLGAFHIYMTSNNVINFFKPLNTNITNLRFGIVFNILGKNNRIVESGSPELQE